jgi:CubicO group peptidase (beta-lactamase class C family)
MPLDVEALARRVDQACQEARIPGLALAVVRGGDVVHAAGAGVTSAEDGVPVTPSTLFRVGSITKSLTGTAAMRLVDQGLLDLDRPVVAELPWFALSDPAATPLVTLRMLLTHTSGLPHDHQPFGRPEPEALERRVRDEIPRYALVAPPGSRYSYSNAGLHVAGFLVATKSGTTYAEAMRRLLFEPLGMTRTTFDPTVAMTYPLAQPHVLDDAGRPAVQHRFAHNAGHYPSGQAISTVLDLARFASFHLGGGRVGAEQLLRPEAVAAMHAPAVEIGDGVHYGLTFRVGSYRGLQRVGHGGAIAGFGARLDMLPGAGLGVALAFNRLARELPADGLVEEIFDQALD